MKRLVAPSAALTFLLASCSPGIDDYHYGYAPAYHTLPAGFTQVEIGGSSYWHHGGRFYRNEGAKGYVLVRPPRGSEQIIASQTPGATPAPSGPPATGGSGLITPGGGSVESFGKAQRRGRSPVRHRSRDIAP